MAQPVLAERIIDDSLSVSDFYYRKFTEINGFILKILKENGRGDGNLMVMEYVDLGERGFLRREKFRLQLFDNNLQLKWEVNIPPEMYINVPKPFYHITANDDYIYFFESGSSPNSTFYSCKVTQLNYKGEIVGTSRKTDVAYRVFATFPGDRGLYIVGHRFLQGPEYYLGVFSDKDLGFSQRKVSLPHTKKEIANWTINKSEYECVTGNPRNNHVWLRKGYILHPMSDDAGISSRFVQLDTAGRISDEVKINFDPAYRNFLGIDTECLEELDKMLTVVLKGAKTGPYFDIYLNKTDGEPLLHKEWHFYDIKKHLREEYHYYDYREISYNHYRNVDHFKAVVYDNFNNHLILIDQVPDGTYFFHVNFDFELMRVDYAKEFSGISLGSSQYHVGILSGFSTIYNKEGFYPRKTALDFIANRRVDNPRNYYYTVFNRKHTQILIIDDLQKRKTRAYELGK